MRRILLFGLPALAAAVAAWFLWLRPAPSPVCVADTSAFVAVPGGTVTLGGNDEIDDGPVRTVSVAPFRMKATEVTNAEFAAFVAATGYVTIAEREGSSAVFTPPQAVDNMVDPSQWWRLVDGATWQHPEGPESDIAARANEPVVQVTAADAEAYARWKGERLPTEAEWETAALATGGGRNTWQGVFPLMDTGTDGFTRAAPVGCFAANALGLHDIIGNVWELTTDRYPGSGGNIVKGGSFLCAPNYCARYRPAARQPGDPTMGASHIGFRTVVG
jgi:formylglycine-generating enzyme required for sulfatase activity